MYYPQYFTNKLTRSGDTIVIFTPDAPESLKTLVHKIHKELGCSFPDDWIYSQISDAFRRLEECSNEDQFNCARGEILTDIYTFQLLEWAKSLWAQNLIEEFCEEFGDQRKLVSMISGGQWLTINRIYLMVWEFMIENKGD